MKAKKSKASEGFASTKMEPFSMHWVSDTEWEIRMKGLDDNPFAHGVGIPPKQLQNMTDGFNEAFRLGYAVGSEATDAAYKKSTRGQT